jgi:hypothetical protein
LAPLLIFAPLACKGATTPITEGQSGREIETEIVSWYDMGMAGQVLPILSFIALTGLLGLLAIGLYKRRPLLGKIFMWISASVMIIVSLFSIFSLGLFFLPASILLIVAAVGLRGSEEIPAEESKDKRASI